MCSRSRPTELEDVKGWVSAWAEHKYNGRHLSGLQVDGGIVQDWRLDITIAQLGNHVARDADGDPVHPQASQHLQHSNS